MVSYIYDGTRTNGGAMSVEIRCLSTDEKPNKGIPVNSLCLEVDTKTVFYAYELDGGFIGWQKCGEPND